MIYLAIALVVWGVLAFKAFQLYLESKNPRTVPADSVEDLRADINRINLALNIRTYKTGEKK